MTRGGRLGCGHDAERSRSQSGRHLFGIAPDKNFRLHVGGQIQQDWVFFDQDESLEIPPPPGWATFQDGVFFRRARLKLDGTAYGIVEWEADVEFANSTDVVYDDLWAGFTKVPHVGNIRLGHVKVPQGLESVTSNRHFTFMERATIFDAFTQEYDPGILLFRTATNQRAVYALCFHRIDDQAEGIDFGDGEYAATARVNGLPIWKGDGQELLHLGASYSYRNAEFPGAGLRDTVRFRARPEVREGPLLPRFVDTGNVAADAAEVAGLELAYVNKSLSFQTEYMRAEADDTAQGDAQFDGFYAYASWFITGESRPYDRRIGRFTILKPKQNFAFDRKESTGAFELALRFSALDLDSKGVRAGQLDDWTLGLHWYLNPNFKIQWNVVWARRDIPGPAEDGSVTAYAMRSTWAY